MFIVGCFCGLVTLAPFDRLVYISTSFSKCMTDFEFLAYCAGMGLMFVLEFFTAAFVHGGFSGPKPLLRTHVTLASVGVLAFVTTGALFREPVDIVFRQRQGRDIDMLFIKPPVTMYAMSALAILLTGVGLCLWVRRSKTMIPIMGTILLAAYPAMCLVLTICDGKHPLSLSMAVVDWLRPLMWLASFLGFAILVAQYQAWKQTRQMKKHDTDDRHECR